jgi:hypothetical protein
MALSTYSELQTTIASYLARNDLTSVIPDFIRLAEQRLGRDLRIRQLLSVSTAITTPSDNTVGLPTDFIEMRDIHLDTNPISGLTYMAPNNFYRKARVKEAGKPVNYTVLAAEMQLAPIPDAEYTLQMLYYAKPDPLSVNNQSNVWLAYCPDALLYAALGEAEPYLMNDARLQTWGALYERAITAISNADQGSEYSGQPMSMTFN